jgi:uncharacterized membrane protein
MDDQQRFIELDFWRGLAIIGMAIFHFIFLLDYLGYQDIHYTQGAWNILARLVQFSFLLLVGIGMHLSYQKSVIRGADNVSFYLHQIKKGIIVLMSGMVVTFFTMYFIPGDFVKFGILHFIGASILVLSFIAHRPIAAGLFGILIFLLTPVVQSISVSIPVLLIFGFSYPFSSVDYFPIFPWMAVPALGIFIGACLYKNYQPRWWGVGIKEKVPRLLSPVIFLGRKSLLVYLLHIPILMGIVWCVGRFFY